MNTHCNTLVFPGGPSSGCNKQERPDSESTRWEKSKVGTWETTTTFHQLLCWLGPDPESAAEQYESIRKRLISMFRARRCVFAEDLADATFERVARKINHITNEYSGDPARYFYGVAKKIFLEYQRRVITVCKRDDLAASTKVDSIDLQHMLDQLEEALSILPETDRELILTYYTGSGKEKIQRRRALADHFGLPLTTLRLRVFRIRRELKNYMLQSQLD